MEGRTCGRGVRAARALRGVRLAVPSRHRRDSSSRPFGPDRKQPAPRLELALVSKLKTLHEDNCRLFVPTSSREQVWRQTLC